MEQAQSTGAKYWLWALIAVAPVLRLLVSVGDDSLWFFWGVNHAAFYSWIWTLSVSLLVIGGLFVALRCNCSSLFWGFAETTRGQVILALIGLVLFFFASADSHLFGSGLIQVGNIGQRTEPFIDQYATGATQLHWAVYQALSGATGRVLNDAALAVQSIAALSGALCVFLWLRIITALTPDAHKRPLIAVFLIFSSATLLFFGNGDLFAPTALLITLFLWLALSLLRAKTNASRIVCLLALILTVAVGHWYQAQMILLTPALVFVIGLGFFPGTYERFWGVLGIVSLIALVFAVYQLGADDLWIKARLMGWSGKPPEFNYGMFSWSRIIDLVNSSLALWPLAPLTLWLLVRYVWSERCDHVVGFLAMASLSSICWIIISDFPGGAPREIVTLAPFAIPPALLAGYLFAKRAPFSDGKSHKILSAVAVWSLLMIAPVHLFGDSSVAYLDNDLQTRAGRYRSGLVNFRDHYFFTRQFPKADYWERLSYAKAIETLDMSTVQEQLLRGQISGGMNRAEFLITSHPYWEEPYGALASALRATGRFDSAFVVIEKALSLNPPLETHIVIEGDIFRGSKQYGEALTSYKRAVAYDARSVLARSRLAMLLARLQDDNAALRHAYLIFENDPTSPYSFLIVAITATHEGDYQRAIEYMSMVTPIAAKLPERALIEQLMTRLRIETLRNETE
ncbi:hypothetical protein JYT16_01130 [Gemmatimonas aurantiaca]|nr:hypothetical protein [Gemmatimonas aurantiaca]